MKYVILIFFTFLFIFSSTLESVAQVSCLVTHYTRSQYAAGSQNWSIDMDKQGFVYSANNSGLMKYDGVKWSVFPMPSGKIARSVLVDTDDRIYTGAIEEFGYWTKDESKGLVYTSLVPLLKNFDLHNHEIWKIVQSQDKIYFQGFSCLFVYDKHTVTSIRLPGTIVFLLKAGERLFAHAVSGDLFEVMNDKFVKIDYSNLLHGTEVKTILPYKNGSFLIGTSSKGVFVFDKAGIKPWDVPANPLLKEFQINNGIIFDNKIVFGTIVKGLFILDADGRVLDHLYSENELQNNTVLSLYNDNNQSIWVGLDNGIDNVSLNNPVDIYPGKNVALGTVYTAALQGNTLYLGTNRGIFTFLKDSNRFTYTGFLQNSQGQVWQLKVIDGTLFCGHTNGTYIIEGNSFKKIFSVSGGYMLQKFQVKGDEYLLESTYTNLVIYKKSGNTWVYSHQVEGFLEPARFIEIDHLGNIWIAHSIKGLYRLRLNDSLNRVTEKQTFTQKDGLPSNTNIRVFKIKNRVVFSNSQQLFTWDDLKQKIIPYIELNSQLQGFEAAVSITPVDENTYWFATKTEAALFNLKENNAVMLYRLIFNQYNLSLVDNYENIVPLTDNLHLICLDNGFAIFNKDVIPQNELRASKLVIRDISCWDASGNILDLDPSGNSVSVRNSYNNIAISFSTLQSPCSRKLYQFKLEGIDKDWSRWSESTEAKYTRLPVGEYKFTVRTLNANGTITEPVTLKLKVKPAWYASIVATLLYILIGLGGIIASQYYSRKRLDIMNVCIGLPMKSGRLKSKNQSRKL